MQSIRSYTLLSLYFVQCCLPLQHAPIRWSHPSRNTPPSTSLPTSQNHKSSKPINRPPQSPSRTSIRGDIALSPRRSPVSSPVIDMSQSRSPQLDAVQPTTPTPHKGARRRRANGKQSVQRKSQNNFNASGDDVGPDNERSSEDDELLFDLLGVPTPAKANTAVPGLLPITKDQMKSSNTRSTKRQENAHDSGRTPSGRDGEAVPPRGKGRRKPRGSMSDSEAFTRPVSARKGKLFQPDSDIQSEDAFTLPPADTSSSAIIRKGKGRPASQKVDQTAMESSQSFDLHSLSQSLPSVSGLEMPPPTSAKKKKEKKSRKVAASGNDESSVWDMPDMSGPGGAQTLTWQQQLQATELSSTPRRDKSLHTSTKSLNHASDPKPRARPKSSHPANIPNPPISYPLVNKPTQTRRRSLDGSVPLSAFDHTIPYHTGFNVNRAPQTPIRLPTSQSAASDLPILQGDFPRLKHGSKGPLGGLVPKSNPAGGPVQGIKYAGPTFHNSPHAASLPKPDLEDF
ncbi:hypothetical protein BD324DRAFT_608367 [Kockovaella imperatae]|uniref:Uncharacterized protein n=1 Tax=Kockovaella imperatae TaxID=4999 RepID=A0A1Y1UIS7_9TREE|nr:hypothetical protein BD324DRAFT_608367 [Kockovaella imperatae]ORX37958.1 hypothetical protein BD324DRAFT_608367 [Kockovaella imperatae]